MAKKELYFKSVFIILEGFDYRVIKVICLTTNEAFNSIRSASKKYLRSSISTITGCCMGRNRSAGKFDSGKKPRWVYLNKYSNGGEIYAS